MCEHCHEEEYNAVILNLEDQDLECGVITIFEMDDRITLLSSRWMRTVSLLLMTSICTAITMTVMNRKSNTSMMKMN